MATVALLKLQYFGHMAHGTEVCDNSHRLRWKALWTAKGIKRSLKDVNGCHQAVDEREDGRGLKLQKTPQKRMVIRCRQLSDRMIDQ